ncbi:MAG: transporter substrate-binding domain-containing protein [Burkholderiales bacterium]|nr:transporter substrate-binding domain-containing protein [Burkholderiales bacterium]
MNAHSQDPIRVGMLFSETGVTSVIETSERMGTLLAIEEINDAGGIDGRPLEVVRYDPQSRPVLYREYAERLMAEDGVRIILGCYMTSTRRAVIPVLERWNGLLLYPTVYEGFEYSRHVIYTGAAPNQNSVQLAEFMMRAFGSRVWLLGSDYMYPYESNRIMSDLVLERGGEKVAEQYLPLDARRDDYEAMIRQIKKAAPDFIFSTVVGEGTAMLYRAYADAGLDPSRMPIASLTTCEAEIQQMGAAVAAGHITSAPYFQSVDTEANRRCVAAFHRRFGDDHVTNQCWEAAYFQTHLLANAMRRVGPDSVAALLGALQGSEFEAPQGLVRVDEQNHHCYLRPRIGRADAHGQFEILEEAREWVRPDPYLVSHTLEDWSVKVRLEPSKVEPA